MIDGTKYSTDQYRRMVYQFFRAFVYASSINKHQKEYKENGI